jgi:hypothetical protein
MEAKMVGEALNLGQIGGVVTDGLAGFDHNGRYQSMTTGIYPGGRINLPHRQQPHRQAQQ